MSMRLILHLVMLVYVSGYSTAPPASSKCIVTLTGDTVYNAVSDTCQLPVCPTQFRLGGSFSCFAADDALSAVLSQ